ncbi:unnamed protein product [Mytilus edulis]|uniref:Uncharacterized protein n=1 Tax=Mytilus edulis TaxID=6550 RepID=A0A8S3QXM6_MYTED|nr:unnamed protein product [Mytilus edulis]
MVVKSMFTCCLDNVVITCKHIADWCGLSFQINSGETLILPSNQCEREADMESEQQWTDTQKQFINDYKIYYHNMGLLVNEIDLNGPTDNIADVNRTISRETFTDVYLLFDNESETNIVEKLNKGIRNLKRQDAQTLLIHINFGQFLNLAKAWLENERKEGRIQQSWSVWLKEKTGYSDDHARKLRALAKVLHGYQQFFYVGLPLNFILGKLKEIEIMLQIPDYNVFWRGPVVLPTTNALQSSQDDTLTLTASE